MIARLPSSRVNHRDLYPWASDELLDECSSLVSTRALRDHVGDPSTYDHRAFAKRHDDDIAVLPCTLGEPVCGDERANNGVPFFLFLSGGLEVRRRAPAFLQVREGASASKVAAGPGVEVRRWGFSIAPFKLRRPLKCSLILCFT